MGLGKVGLTRHVLQYTPERASMRAPPWIIETSAILFASNDRQHHFVEAFDGLGPGLAISVGDSRPLGLRKLPLEFASLRRQLEQTLAPIV